MTKYLGLSYRYIPSLPYELDLEMGMGHTKKIYVQTRVNIIQGHLYEKPANVEKYFNFDRNLAENVMTLNEWNLLKFTPLRYQ